MIIFVLGFERNYIFRSSFFDFLRAARLLHNL